ncbi:MAG: hypothetical protein IJP86_03300 [Synergistaceae bacterium]|nr:hypothetical protein [Synergistaceae bacterium]
MSDLRREMLETMSLMLSPARKILGMTAGGLSSLSGIPEGIILDVEEGISPLKPEHYLALSAAIGSTGAKCSGSINAAITRLMTPEGEAFEASGDGFTLVRKWLEADYSTPADDDSVEEHARILSDSELEAAAKSYRIIAGLSAVEDENFPALVSRLQPWLKACGGRICVPAGVVDELRDTLDDTEDDDEEIIVSDALSRIERFQKEGLIDLAGSYEGGRTAAEILGMNKDSRRTILVTQDPDEASSMPRGNARAARITDTGDLELWEA